MTQLFLSGIVVWLAGAMASLALWRQPSAARRVGCGTALGGSLLVLVGSAAAIFSGSSAGISLPFGNPVFSWAIRMRSEEHTSELQSLRHLVCRLLLEKKKRNN